MKVTKRYLIGIAIIVVLLVFTYAGYTLLYPSQPTAEEKVLVMATEEEPDDLFLGITDPAYMPASPMLDTLFIRGLDQKIYGYLVKDWTVSPDSLTYIWHLRQGVKFHTGYPFNASAIVKWFETTATDPKNAYSAYLTALKNVEVVDEYTVKVNLKRPDGFFLRWLSFLNVGGVHDPSAIVKYGDRYGKEFVSGTGPFKFVKWVRGEYIEYARNEEYNWAPNYVPGLEQLGKPKIDRIIVRFIHEPAAQLAELLTGSIDYVHRITPDFATALKKYPGRVVLSTVDSVESYYVYFNAAQGNITGQGLFKDKRVREAVFYAINRTDFVLAMAGFATEMYSNLPPAYGDMVLPLKDTLPKYDIQKALALLNEAGWTIGSDGWLHDAKGNRFVAYAPTWNPAPYPMLTTILQSQLKKIGMDVKIELFDWSSYAVKFRKQGAHDIGLLSYGATAPNSFQRMLMGKNIGANNQFFYNNSEVNSLFDRLGSLTDQAELTAALKRIQQITVAEDYVWLSLFNSRETQAHGPWVLNADYVLDKNDAPLFGFMWPLLLMDINPKLKP